MKRTSIPCLLAFASLIATSLHADQAQAQTSPYGDAECSSCVQSKCPSLEDVNLLTLFNNKPLGRTALTCALNADLAGKPLGLLAGYCGDVDDPRICFDRSKTGAGQIPNGPCRSEFEAAWGTTNRTLIATIAEDPDNQGGAVGFVSNCLAEVTLCASECVGTAAPAPAFGGFGAGLLALGIAGLGVAARRRND